MRLGLAYVLEPMVEGSSVGAGSCVCMAIPFGPAYWVGATTSEPKHDQIRNDFILTFYFQHLSVLSSCHTT